MGAPLSVLLLAAWNAALWCSTGEADLLVGTAFDGRTCAEIDEAFGLFVRYLPVSCEVSPRSTLRQLIEALAPRVAELAEAQDGFPLDSLEKLLAGSDGSPVWSFGFDCERPAAPRGGSPRFTFRGGSAEADRFALRLSVFEGPSLECELHYDPQRFDRQDAERLLARFVRVLTAAVAVPDRRLAELDVLSEAERRDLLEGFNRTAAPFPSGSLCHELFAEQVRRVPQATALVCGAERWIYQELDERANRLAHHLRALGVRPESFVGLCLERSPEMVAGLLAVL
jgi:non-ribosomal peptide synthetase component F